MITSLNRRCNYNYNYNYNYKSDVRPAAARTAGGTAKHAEDYNYNCLILGLQH